MTHLYIELNTGLTEEVNSSIISKLYELAISGDLDNTSDLKGRLHSTYAYEKHAKYLTDTYLNLYITYDDGFIEFEDSVVEQICTTKYANGKPGCSENDLRSVTSIGGTFTDNTNIVNFDEFLYFTGITYIGRGFRNCTNLKKVTLPSSLIYLCSQSSSVQGDGFGSCSSLESIVIPASVTTVSNGCFRNCTNLSSVTFLGSGITIFEVYMFNNCTSLTSITIPNSVTTLRGGCLSSTGLTSITIPNSVTSMSGAIFSGSSNLASVTFEPGDTPLVLEALTSGIYAPGVFRDCAGLANKNIYLPTRLSKIRKNGLGTLNAIRFIFQTETPPTVTDGLADVFKGSIYVPDNAINTYKAATGFSDFADKIFPVSELPNS